MGQAGAPVVLRERTVILDRNSSDHHAREDAMANKTISYANIANKLMTKASRARAKKRANAILKRMALDELRKVRKVTQGKRTLSKWRSHRPWLTGSRGGCST